MHRIEIRLPILIPDLFYRIGVFTLLKYRRLRYGYPFRRISLTQGKYAIVDPEDYERLNKHKWYATKMKHTFYAERRVATGRNRRYIRIVMHREVLKVPDGMFVDHINHNGLDNRKSNLRPATYVENNRNRRKMQTNCYSRFKGVSWCKIRGKWQALISFNGKQRRLGYFDNEVEAACAYDNAARIYHGEFAVLNFGTKE